jgi:N-acyl-L-homoserine lactone synthetase
MQYQQCLQRSGRSIGRFLFSPLQPNKQDLQQDQGLSTAAMEQRVIGHLRRLGLYEGESLYSIKRGAMQHDFYINGASLQVVGEAADIDTPAVVATYLDLHRHAV